jgi:cysteine desulfurase
MQAKYVNNETYFCDKIDKQMTIYLDCNATTPIDPRIAREVFHFMTEEYGNASSRTHEFGLRAKQAVQKARSQISQILNAEPEEVIFTSGATESNNLTILGIAEYGEREAKKHIISSQIEHKSVLEPLHALSKKGFKITLLPPTQGGWVEPESVTKALQDDTLLVSVMHVNNETGVIQPINEIAEVLTYHSAFFHVDAAQGFGKEITPLQNQRIDCISISGHKLYGPKGIGALIAKRRGYNRLPLSPLMYGGGQERGLRPGTLPVPLIVGLGMAAELGLKESEERYKTCYAYRKEVLEALEPLNPTYSGDQNRTLPHVINVAFKGLDSEAIMVALKNIVAISNGSACTSQSYEPSHVLRAMGLSDEIIKGAIRLSWCHMTEHPDWEKVVERIKSLY